MANTNTQVEAEKWIRAVELPKLFKQQFKQQSLLLKSGVEYKFDSVSDDGNIVAVISTSSGETSSGKQDTDNLQKVRSAVYWVLMIDQKPEKMLLVLTDQSMINLIKEERKKGRFPKEVEIIKIKLPEELAQRVTESQREEM